MNYVVAEPLKFVEVVFKNYISSFVSPRLVLHYIYSNVHNRSNIESYD